MLYEERSRKRLAGFNLSHRIDGFWDARGTDIDLVAVDDDARVIRFGSAKRNPDKLLASLAPTEARIARFLEQRREYRDYTVEKVALAPHLSRELSHHVEARGWIREDLGILTTDLL